MRQTAERLMDYETKGCESARQKIAAACLISEKLRPQLTMLMGRAGYRALLSRSLALANEEVDSLRVMHVNEDGTLADLDALETQVDPEEIFTGCTVLLAHLLGLLVAFIGEHLTLQLVRESWPKLPPPPPQNKKALK